MLPSTEIPFSIIYHLESEDNEHSNRGRIVRSYGPPPPPTFCYSKSVKGEVGNLDYTITYNLRNKKLNTFQCLSIINKKVIKDRLQENIKFS